MLVKLVPCKNYFDLTHDMDDEDYNDPDDSLTWDWHGTEEQTVEKPCSINGSPFLSAKGVGRIIYHLVRLARMGRIEGAYGYVDLSVDVDAVEL